MIPDSYLGFRTAFVDSCGFPRFDFKEQNFAGVEIKGQTDFAILGGRLDQIDGGLTVGANQPLGRRREILRTSQPDPGFERTAFAWRDPAGDDDWRFGAVPGNGRLVFPTAAGFDLAPWTGQSAEEFEGVKVRFRMSLG